MNNNNYFYSYSNITNLVKVGDIVLTGNTNVFVQIKSNCRRCFLRAD